MTGWHEQMRTTQFYNNSGEVIPPFAAMELEYHAESSKSANELLDGNEILWQVKKPTSAITLGRLVFNAGAPVPIGGYGLMQLDPFATALADLTTAMSPDDECGPVAGSWYIKKSGSGLLFRSYDSYKSHYVSATIRTIFVSPSGGGNSLFKATMNEAWTAGVAECSIFTIDGVTFTDTTIDADVYDGLLIFSELTTGNSLLVIKQAGKYYAIQAPCP